VVPPAKVAETLMAAASETEQVVCVPEHAPPHPWNLAPAAGVARSVTVEFTDWLALQTTAPLPQLIPPPVTEPLPETATESGTVVGGGPVVAVPVANVAVTDLESVIENVQVV
jgi:hypothetical protein